MIRILIMLTRLTYKLRLAAAIRLLSVAAPAARLGRVRRVNNVDRHARQRGFVLDLLSEVVECPIAQATIRRPSRPLSLRNRCLVANTAEVFHSDTAPSAFGLLDEVLADTVVYVALKSPLPTRKLLQSTFRRARADRLQDSTTLLVPLPFCVDSRTAVRFTVAVGGDVFDSEVHPERFIHVFGVGLFDVAGRQQVKPSIVIDEVALALLILHQTALTLTSPPLVVRPMKAQRLARKSSSAWARHVPDGDDLSDNPPADERGYEPLSQRGGRTGTWVQMGPSGTLRALRLLLWTRSLNGAVFTAGWTRCTAVWLQPDQGRKVGIRHVEGGHPRILIREMRCVDLCGVLLTIVVHAGSPPALARTYPGKTALW